MLVKKHILLGISMGMSVFIASPTMAADEMASVDIPVYKPKVMGAPTRRVGGGSRGLCDAGKVNTSLTVLASIYTGTTSTTQPNVYWSISEDISKPIEVTLNTTGFPPVKVFESVINAPKAGIHAINFKQQNITLEAGTEYELSLALICNADDRSADIGANSAIQYEPPSSSLSEKLAGVQEMQRPFIYAQAGFWYDAIDSVLNLVGNEPSNAKYSKWRDALLQNVNLKMRNNFVVESGS